MKTTEVITYGQVAYEAYRAHSDGKSLVSGEPIPEWSSLSDAIKGAWTAAGNAVSDAVIGDGLTITPHGYQGAAQHTYTTACDGFHEPGQCPPGVVAQSITVRSPLPDESREAYQAYLDGLFAPVQAEIGRLRAAMGPQ